MNTENRNMSAETFVKLLEEMVDLKVQHHLANQIKMSSALTRVVASKRESDRQRAAEIRTELINALTT
jgi:hypothetical protein